jgi:hypothetical protein
MKTGLVELVLCRETRQRTVVPEGDRRGARRPRQAHWQTSRHLLPSVRGDLLAKLGRYVEARAEVERAAALTRNARERSLLLERAATLREASGTAG